MEALDPYLRHLKRELTIVILDPRLSNSTRGDGDATIQANGNVMEVSNNGGGSGPAAALADVSTFLEFLAANLPTSICLPLSALLMPDITSRLVEDWLDPCVPTNIDEMPFFQQNLDYVSKLASQIDALQWTGSSALREWVQSAPRTWLNKRRETALGAVRSLLFTGLRERNTVERVETQTVSKGDVMMGGSQDDDAWDEAWEEEEAQKSPVETKTLAPTTNHDDEDASAWGMEEDEPEETAAPTAEPGKAADEDDGTEAWGWEDEEPSTPSESRPPPREETRQTLPVNDSAKAVDEREVTLRETYTVTAVPDGILEIIVKVVLDAESLTSPRYDWTIIFYRLYQILTVLQLRPYTDWPCRFGSLHIANIRTCHVPCRGIHSVRETGRGQHVDLQ